MKLYVKHMVSKRCKMLVMEELDKLQIRYVTIQLGVIDVIGQITKEKRNLIGIALQGSGLELIEDQREMLIEQIKTVIIELIHYSDGQPKVNFSDYLSNKLNYNYTYLSNLFTDSEGVTIEHFIIAHKIERVKELISYNELTFSEIAFKLHYSSIGHLSNQFKKVTGSTLSFYRKRRCIRYTTLENL